jgi:hypothetical protein
MPNGWASRDKTNRIAIPHSHRLAPTASSTAASRIRKIGVYSAKLAWARIRVATRSSPPSPIDTLRSRRKWLTRSASQMLSSAQAPAMVSVIGRNMVHLPCRAAPWHAAAMLATAGKLAIGGSLPRAPGATSQWLCR